MIGQTSNKEVILTWVKKNRVPHFIIIVGPKGSGKTCLTKYIAESIQAMYCVSDIKVDAIREIIDTAYTTTSKIVYHIKDADNMRPEAKNALLKITEEPPKSAYFVLSVESDSVILNTLKSRSQILIMCPYKNQELKEYAEITYPECSFSKTLDLAVTPYFVDLLASYDQQEFLDYVNLVIENIGAVQPANAFKSASKLKFKDTDEGFDLILFFRAFVSICEKKIQDGFYENKWAEAIIVTVPYIDWVGKLGVNKQQVYDSWVFDIREVLYDNN